MSSNGTAQPQPRRVRRPTATANFGSGRREAHDASAFYNRFVAPELSTDTKIEPAGAVDVIHEHDARNMVDVASNSVALVVTSPPYFAGKQYEETLGEGGVPADYFEYLTMLRDVFDECRRVLEPGGRIAVNVANLGRRPYRSLSGDVTEILSDLGLLLRGEVIWWKGRAAGGSCAWGSFQRPANPVLRDVTERVVIASKGRFDRALTPDQRHARGLPSTATISRDEFMAATTDLWEIAPESATRVGHPAPFPVALPQRFIDLYTYAGDVVLDPFMGSGSTAVAAVRTNRHFIGFDTDGDYIGRAWDRITTEREALSAVRDGGVGSRGVDVELPAVKPTIEPNGDGDAAASAGDDAVGQAVREGRKADEVAEAVLEACGFVEIRRDVKPRGAGITLDFVARDATGHDWAFDFTGAFTVGPTGLRHTDSLWKSLATAAVFREARGEARTPLVFLTTEAPTKGSAQARALSNLTGPDRAVFDVIELLDPQDQDRLRAYAMQGRGDAA